MPSVERRVLPMIEAALILRKETAMKWETCWEEIRQGYEHDEEISKLPYPERGWAALELARNRFEVQRQIQIDMSRAEELMILEMASTMGSAYRMAVAERQGKEAEAQAAKEKEEAADADKTVTEQPDEPVAGEDLSAACAEEGGTPGNTPEVPGPVAGSDTGNG